MTKDLTAKILVLFFLGSSMSRSIAVVAVEYMHPPVPPQPQQASNKKIRTLMCTTESCTNADANTPGCEQYTTPLDSCYNAQTLFPDDESWSDLDIYDTMIMKNLKRTFYESKDGSCAGREGEEEGGASSVPQPVDGDDSFTLPIDACVGPFGPPRPWGKFSLLDDYDDSREEEDEVLSTE